VNRDGAARAVADLLRALGYDPDGQLAATPALVAEAWCDELLDGTDRDPAAILRAGAMPIAGALDTHGGLVVLRDLAVTSMCPHHLLPSHGWADVVYLPGEQLAGFGAVAQALRALTRRLTLQEQAGGEMARALVAALGARGAACRLRLRHSCLIARGAREPAAIAETLALAGTFTAAGPDRELALGALGAERGRDR
jgi:GTP cyclohydrolase I